MLTLLTLYYKIRIEKVYGFKAYKKVQVRKGNLSWSNS
jgi:hypothetical protein